MGAPRNITSWLPNLLGPLDLQGNGASLVPRRQTLNFVGGTVTDNPDFDRTDIALGAGVSPVNLRGSFVSRPAAGAAGRLYFCTDPDVPLVFFDDGSTWHAHGFTQAFSLGGRVPGDFTIVQNGSGATLTDGGGSLLFARSYGGVFNQENWSCATVGAGGAPGTAEAGGTPTPYTCTIGFEFGGSWSAGSGGSAFTNAKPSMGICRRDGTVWSALICHLDQGGFNLINATGNTTGSGISTNFNAGAAALKHRIIWLRVTDDGSDPEPPGAPTSVGTSAVTFHYSVDGKIFKKLWTEHRSVVGSNFAYWHAGLILNPYNSDAYMRVFDFSLAGS